jgi:hypothetical protein
VLTRISRDDFGLTKSTAERKGAQDGETLDPCHACPLSVVTAIYPQAQLRSFYSYVINISVLSYLPD